jgi:hypothetical protein
MIAAPAGKSAAMDAIRLAGVAHLRYGKGSR